jgi:hypothetical protein
MAGLPLGKWPDRGFERPLMISDLDIYRAANLPIERHGADAVIQAARLVDRMLDRGDRDGQLVWYRIKRAIEALQAPASGPPH